MEEITPQVVDRMEKKPAGLIPKNIQNYLMIGVSLVLVIIIWTSSGQKKEAPKEKVEDQKKAEETLRFNESKLQEYKRELEIQQKQLKNQPTVTAEASMNGNDQARYPIDYQRGMEHSYSQAPADPKQELEKQLAAEKRKKDYQSLFADNIALSYRQKPKEVGSLGNNSAVANGRILLGSQLEPVQKDPLSELDRYQVDLQNQMHALANSSLGTAQGIPAGSPPSTERTLDKENSPVQKAKSIPVDYNRASGDLYRVLEGTFIESVLLNRLNADFSGPVAAMVTNPVYSHDRQRILIPTGSKVIGESQKVSHIGQRRVAVVFHRLLMPDGYSVSLDQFVSLNQIGETALRDQVNNHYLQIFGVSLALGAISGFTSWSTEAGSYGMNRSAADAYRQGVSESLSSSSQRILDRFLNIMPTLTIREGHRIKVFLTGDLLLPDYAMHQMPADLTHEKPGGTK
jgi:type IV secretion system protein TrbI